MQKTKVWGEKDLADEAARETRLGAIETLVGPAYSFDLISMTFCASARDNNRKQLVIDLLDLWMPATGAELLKVNEGTLGILGYVLNKHEILPLTFGCHSLISSLLGVKAHWQVVNGK